MAKPILHQVKLTAAELLRLDGVTSPDVQKSIDLVKEAAALSARFHVGEAEGIFLASAVREGRTSGRLGFSHAQVRWCEICGKGGGYAKHSRSTRSHRKGDNDTSRPLMLSGVDLARGFINFIGWPSLGCCAECWDTLRPMVVELIEPLPIEAHPKITGHAERWKRWDHMGCKSCGWEGHEGEMGQLRTLMNDGYYPGRCPSCGAENVFLSRVIERRGEGFTMVPVPIPWCELPKGLAAVASVREKGVAHAENAASKLKSIEWENPPEVRWLPDLESDPELKKHEKELVGAFNAAVSRRWAELKIERRKTGR